MIHRMTDEEQNIYNVIKSARSIQDFLWGDMNKDCGLEEFKRMFRKRVAKIDEVMMENPHWRVELKKRCLQVAAIAVNVITMIDGGTLTHAGIHPSLPSNLPEYAKSNTNICPNLGVSFSNLVIESEEDG